MNFEHQIKVFDVDGDCLGTFEPQDETFAGDPYAWAFRPERCTISQSELEQIAAKLKELNQAARPGVKGE